MVGPVFLFLFFLYCDWSEIEMIVIKVPRAGFAWRKMVKNGTLHNRKKQKKNKKNMLFDF